jgi:3-hydroxyisobutyrate dehydrogenase-like beta-hydroxyacid dehydrogenase
MRKIGIIGLGDMGSGMARNLLKAGFEVAGFDRNQSRCDAFAAMGGSVTASAAEAGREADAVIVMVMDGAQAKEVALELAGVMPEGATVILSPTIRAAEAREIAGSLADAGIGMIDSPVTGGRTGAQNGTLTMIAAGPDVEMERCRPVMEAISANIYLVGTEPGQGQTAKACLQSIVGTSIASACESAAMAAKAGLSGEVFQKIVANSAAGSTVTSEALSHVIDRAFAGTGAKIDTQFKDLTITTELARDLGVPLHVASAALQLVVSAKTRYGDCDNWAIARLGEEIAGVELHRSGPIKLK